MVHRMGTLQRKTLMEDLFQDVIYPQRMHLLGYNKINNQTAMVDNDGHLSQLIVSIATGIPGTNEKGKTGDEPGDLKDGSEVKAAYRLDQKGGKEDAHIHFGKMNREQLEEFFTHATLYTVHHGLTVSGHYKCEIHKIDMTKTDVQNVCLAQIGAGKKDLQPRLYPDANRKVLAGAEGGWGLKALQAQLIARIIQTENDEAIIDVWSPQDPKPIEDGLKIKKKHLDLLGSPPEAPSKNPDLMGTKKGAKKFFQECILDYKNRLNRFTRLTNTTPMLGFSFLAQHLASMITGIKGENSKSDGDDLEGGGEVKEAFGEPWDEFSKGKDISRWNLTPKDKEKMMGEGENPWTKFVGLWFISRKNRMSVRVFSPEINHLHEQTKQYWEQFPDGTNLNIFMRGDYETITSFSHRIEEPICTLDCELLIHLRETDGVEIVE